MKRCFPSVPWKRGCSGALVILCGMTAISFAAEPRSREDIFSGFDDTTLPAPAAIAPPEEEGANLFSGFGKLSAAYNFAHDEPPVGQTDWQGLSKLRTELLLEYQDTFKGWKSFVSGRFFYDFAYRINGRGKYNDAVPDEYEREAELGEALIQGELADALDVKLGRQIVVWGRSDNFRVTDVINPLDNREPGLTDIEELRLPVVMSQFDYYFGSWNLDLIALHEHRFDKNPPLGHDFYPATTPMPPEDKPAHILENTEYAAELKSIFPGWDLSCYWARIYNDQANFVPIAPITTEHQKIFMYGAAASLARGNFLTIVEAAHVRGLHFINDYGNGYNRTDILVGIEYQGLSETMISFDYMNRHLHGYNESLAASPELPRKDDGQFALRFTSDHLHDTLHLTGVLVSLGERARYGAIERFSLAYDIADAVRITGGVVFYQSGSGVMENIGDNDRVFTELRYDF